jgi:transcriptional regulator with XRE-family HTH domain
MNQEKIGKFIASCRKSAGLTQAALAEKLEITDRAVSKWENGKSMPDASIMLNLCEQLGISVNELLSGERLDMDDYRKLAEENLLQLKKQEELNNKKLLSLETVIGYSSTISFMVLIFSACTAVTSRVWQATMILTAIVLFTVGIICCLRLEHDVGYYECPHCGKRYVPSIWTVTLAPHFGRNRVLRCPYCRKIGYHRKVMTK